MQSTLNELINYTRARSTHRRAILNDGFDKRVETSHQTSSKNSSYISAAYYDRSSLTGIRAYNAIFIKIMTAHTGCLRQ